MNWRQQVRYGSPEEAVFGFVLAGGALTGAQVRDVRLANELARRGYPVHVWWILERSAEPVLDRRISQRWLAHGGRYSGYTSFPFDDCTGRFISRCTTGKLQSKFVERFPKIVPWALRRLVRHVCRGVEKDPRLIKRFAREIEATGVTHMLPSLGIVCPFVAAARECTPHAFGYLVTFQGYELYANYARELGIEAELYQRLREAVAQSDWPAIAVSAQYRDRISRDIGVHCDDLSVIPPGVPIEEPQSRADAAHLVCQHFPEYRDRLPLITFLGRKDSEKGIDLLLYATKILREQGQDFQLLVGGSAAFGSEYWTACQQIADNLRLPVFASDFVSNELRSALFRVSRCVVYPSIHGEPFGMVPVEAMSQGAPIIVPDTGGVSSLPYRDDLQAGLIFRSWDSGHLADQLRRILQDAALWKRCSEAAPKIAVNYSVEALADRVLEHLGVSPVDVTTSHAE